MDNVQYVDKVTQTWDDSFGTISVYKVVWNDPSGTPQTSYVLGVEHKSVGEKTSEGGEIFNDYVNNMALSLHSFASGSATIAGGRGFKIISQQEISEGVGVYTLSSVNGLEVGMPYSVKLSTAKYNAGVIATINGNDVTVDGYTYIEPYTEEEIASATSEYFRANYLTIVGRPELGDMDVGFNAVALGENCISQDRCGFSAGYNNKVVGQYGFASGQGNVAGYAANASGVDNEALGDNSCAGGSRNVAAGHNSFVQGKNNTSSGYASCATGANNIASGYASSSQGNGNQSIGEASYTNGSGNTAKGHNSYAGGKDNKSSGYASLSSGRENQSIGEYSCTFGYKNKAYSRNCFAEGMGTIATATEQHVQGRYNKNDAEKKYADIVGNGTSDSARSNAYTLDWDGNGWFSGEVECTNIILKSPNGTRFKISVDDNGNLSATKA